MVAAGQEGIDTPTSSTRYFALAVVRRRVYAAPAHVKAADESISRLL